MKQYTFDVDDNGVLKVFVKNFDDENFKIVFEMQDCGKKTNEELEKITLEVLEQLGYLKLKK